MSKQLEFANVKGWGGKRRSAGRKNRTGRVSHAKRQTVDLNKPMHITLKLKPRTSGLRTKSLKKSFKVAACEAKRFGFYVNHYSIQDNHLHLIAEAENSHALHSGMKSFGGRFAKAVRKAIGGSGKVFHGRYHLHVLKTPTEMKNALKYVLLNLAKHMKVIAHIDPYSSARAFQQWRKLLGREYNDLMDPQCGDCAENGEELSPPRSWLARAGWMRAASSRAA